MAYNLRQFDFSLPRFIKVTPLGTSGQDFWSHLSVEERNCQSLKTFKIQKFVASKPE